MNVLEAVCRELREMGLDASPVHFEDFPQSDGAVAFRYAVPAGRFRGQEFEVAISFQESAYPEYPPHFVHIRALAQSRLREYAHHVHRGASWWAFSLPPSDFWDGLRTEEKTMRTYVRRHLARVWDQI